MPSHISSEDSVRSHDDTIVAIITPPGQGGIAALRLAGRDSRAIAQRRFQSNAGEEKMALAPFHLRYGFFLQKDGSRLDEVMVVYMPEGKSYTGAEQIEIYCHGGRQIVKRIMDECIREGARPAEPGEFTRMAFLSGRIDLAKAEAVAEIIAADTEQSLKAGRDHLMGAYSDHIDSLRRQLVEIMAELEASIDFSEEEIEPEQLDALRRRLEEVIAGVKKLLASYSGGRIIKEGFRVTIAGRPNAGKSSLFNLILAQQRALVSEHAGTTRDYLREWIEIGGFAVSLTDTAGLRHGGNAVELSGQKLTKEQLAEADLILWLFDLSEKDWEKKLAEDSTRLPAEKVLVIANKSDLAGSSTEAYLSGLSISCKTGAGIEKLKIVILSRIESESPDLTSGIVVTSARHQQKLSQANDALLAAKSLLDSGESAELLVFEIRGGIDALAEITGKIYNEDILAEIFANFCIGK